MEEWETILEQYKVPPTVKSIENALQVAHVVCEKDLAPFEIDIFLESLLLKPVALLKTVSDKRHDDEWWKVLEKAFALLTVVVEKFGTAEPYYEDIGKLCNLPFTARVATKALECLTHLVKRHRISSEDVQAQIAALAHNDTCKAVRIGLLGALCEYQPELISDVTTIWRTFINLLDSQGSRVSSNVVKTVLEAMCGIFKNFGTELVVLELYEFYEKMTPFLDARVSDDGRTRKRCFEVCCTILEKYSDLFMERVAADSRLSTNLWSSLSVTSRAALLAVYRVKFKKGVNLQETTSELIEHSHSRRALEEFTARQALTNAGITSDLPVDVPELARRLREPVNYDKGEAIAWCIHANVLYSDQLLQAAILYYDSIPTPMRKRVVIYNILEAQMELRVAAITFLTTVTCTSEDTQREKYLSIWRDLFVSNGSDVIVMENSQKLLEDFLKHAVFVLETFLLEELEELPPKLSALLKLTAYILSIQETGSHTLTHSLPRVVEVYARVYPGAEVVAVVRGCAEEGVMDVYKYMDISSCDDEVHMTETCLAFIEAPNDVDCNLVLLAAEILLSKSDTEPAVLSNTVKKLEHIMIIQKDKLEEKRLNKVICLVEKVRRYNNSISKEARILQRDLLLFLGKFGSTDILNKVHNPNDVLIAGLKDLSVNIPVPNEGTTLKLNLHGIMEQAIAVEDPDALLTIITVVCANSRNLEASDTSAVLTRALAALSRRSDVASRAAPLCGKRVAAQLLPYILHETSPQARRVLLEALEVFLTTGSQVQTSEIVSSIIVMCDELNASQAKLDLLSILIRALKENNYLSQKYLPNILVMLLETQISKTYVTFNDASTLFIEKISLFTTEVLTKTIYNILGCIHSKEFVINAKSKKLITNAVSFLKKLYDLNSKLPDVIDLLEAAKGVTSQALILLSSLRCGFDCELSVCRDFMCKDGFLKNFFDVSVSEGVEKEILDAILYFVSVFTDVLLEERYRDTLNLLSRIFQSLNPDHIEYIHKNMSVCLSSVKKELKSQDIHFLTPSLLKWYEGLVFQNVSTSLARKDDIEYTRMVITLKVVLEVLGVKHCSVLTDRVARSAGEWLKCVCVLNEDDQYVDKYSEYLTTLVQVALMVLPAEVVWKIVYNDSEDSQAKAIKLCQKYISVFSKFFISNPNILNEESGEVVTILNDIVQYKVKSGRDDDLLMLVDKLWPVYELNTNIKQKSSLLLDLSCLTSKLSPESNPMRWLMRTLESNTSQEDSIRLMAAVPGGSAYSATYRQFAGQLPTRLSEMRPVASTAFQALLDNFATTKDQVLLEIIASLADGDATSGWWDDAMEECMRLTASSSDAHLLRCLYALSGESRTNGVCTRLLLPMLRYSSPSLCEEFFSDVLEELFSVLKKRPREVAANTVYQKCILEYIRAFDVLRIAFEKIPRPNLESPDSRLYSKMDKPQKPFLIVYNICVYGTELRKKILCPGADAGLKEVVRTFHCSVLNCMSSAICCRSAKPAIYAAVFAADVWRHVVDDSKLYRLPVAGDWQQHTTTRAVSIDLSDGDHNLLTVGTRSRSRTVHFLRTLSENPFLYDIPDVGEATTTQEITLSKNPLNEHECAATLTALVCRVASVPELMERLAEGLRGGPANMRWLLAQIVCNCKEELKPHAATLRPALLAVICDTAEGNKLNQLHVEILKTLIYWQEEKDLPESCVNNFNVVIQYIIYTIKDSRRCQSIVNTLVDKMYKLCDMYAKYVRIPIECFETASEGSVATDTVQIELKILKTFAKTKVDMTSVLPKIFEIFEKGVTDLNIEVPKLLGVALTSVANDVACGYVAKFRVVVSGLRRSSLVNFVKLVYYTQMGYPGCCDEKIIREIADLVHKIPGREKQKCLDIVTTYIENTPPGDYVNELIEMLDIPQLALSAGSSVGTLLRLQQLSPHSVSHPCPTSYEPPKKRSAASAILSQEMQTVISRIPPGTDRDTVARLAQCMSQDIAVRFCEAFSIAVQRATSRRDAACLLLDLVFHQIRSQDTFKSVRLRDEPLECGDPTVPNTSNKSLTQSGQTATGSGDENKPPIDVQISIDDVLKCILEFAKSHPPIASDLCRQLAKLTRRATTDALMCDQLLPLLGSNPGPFVVDICRVYVDSCWRLDGFKTAVEKLLMETKGTEDYDLVSALHQEMRLRLAGPQQFVMGLHIQQNDVEMIEEEKMFTINGLVSSFGTLSNWEDLTIQDKRDVSRKMPILWTDRDTFERCLGDYEGGVVWFDAMLSMYRNDGRNYEASRLLKKLNSWPRNKFDVAAVSEAIEWHYIRDVSHSERDFYKLTCDIQSDECLAKWAARLMLRRLFLKTVEVEYDSDRSDKDRLERSLSLSHQLEWCKCANERGLPMLALQCLEDVKDLYESETLKWLQQKMIALRTIGLQRNDSNKLEEALDLYEYTSQFRNASSYEDIFGVEFWRYVLLKDLQRISVDDLKQLCADIQKLNNYNEAKQQPDCFVFTMTALDDVWEANDNDTNTNILMLMAKILKKYIELSEGSNGAIFADMILKRLGDFDLKNFSIEVSTAVLDALNSIKELDDFALDTLRRHRHLFSNTEAHTQLFDVDNSLASWKQMIVLIADPTYTLLQYCVNLQTALRENNKNLWSQTFKRMQMKIFENSYAGPDYQVLFRHKDTLYSVEDYDKAKTEAKPILTQIISQLTAEVKASDRRSLNVSQLCPQLCDGIRTSDPTLCKLLWLPQSAHVEFDETVSVFTDSIRRACVLTVRVCGGAGGRRRYIVKGGEPMRLDAAAMRAQRATGYGGYRVTPLSEDCGIIEYLEHHERVRTLILKSASTEIANLSSTSRNDNQILLSRKAAVEQFEEYACKVPTFLLRSAIEQNSTNVDDFLSKSSNFVESLSAITIVNWLLGVGDRHLENLMYNCHSGALCNIDWGAALQYGSVEIPCSRLTANILGVCDLRVLESRLQSIIQRMRENQTLLLAALHVSFGWMEDFNENIVYIEGLLRGTVLSYQITRDVLQKSNVKYKEKYIALLDEVFEDFEHKELYTVEEQVSCLLRQSTDPRILSVTRFKWEPWL